MLRFYCVEKDKKNLLIYIKEKEINIHDKYAYIMTLTESFSMYDEQYIKQ